MHNWMLQEPLETTLERMRKHGYASIELTPDKSVDAAEVIHLLDDRGIDCSGIVVPPADYSLVSSTAEQRQAAVTTAKHFAALAARLGASEITLVPAEIGRVDHEGDPGDEWRWAIEGLTEIAGYATELGVKIAVEPLTRFETYFINRADQAVALADAVGDGCGVCLDSFHMNIEEENLAQAIRTVGDRLYAFHLGDSNRLGCGMGHLNWAEIVAALREIDYHGALSLECVPIVDRTAPERDHNASASFTAALNQCMAETARTIAPLIADGSSPSRRSTLAPA